MLKYFSYIIVNIPRIWIKCYIFCYSIVIPHIIKQTLVIICGCWIVLKPVFAQISGDAFLNIGTYPRSIGLGQAVAALPLNPGGCLENPAATGFNQATEFFLMHINQYGMANLLSAGISSPVNKTWQAGAGLISFGVDDIPEHPDLRKIRDMESRRDSIRAMVARGFTTFRDRESCIYFNLSRNFTRLIDLGWYTTPFPVKIPVGLNLKLIHKELHDLRGYGIGVDAGSMINFSLNGITGYNWLGQLSLGMAVSDILGAPVYWDSGKMDRTEMALVSGVGYTQNFNRLPITILLLYQQESAIPETRIGIEITWKDMVAIRFGSDRGAAQGGLGLLLPFRNRYLGLDYSFAAHSLGDAHRLGGSIVF